VVSLSALIVLIALGVLSCFAVFLAADRVSRWLGVTGNVVLTRLLGVILAGLAVQFIINGIESLLRPAAL
jgi:multiple antibiotic resistance protein